MSEGLTRYLYLLRQQWFANQLGFGSDWSEGMDEMELLWRSFTDEEQDESERRFAAMKRELEDWRPDAPVDLGLVDREARSGVPRVKS